MLRRFVAVCLASVSLAACAPTNGDLELTGARYQTLQASIKPGDLMRLGPFVSTASNCAKVGQAKARVLSAPLGGHIAIGSRAGEVYYGDDRKFPYCNGRPTAGTSVVYTTRPGFVGDDSFAFHLAFGDGEQRTIRVNVHVE